MCLNSILSKVKDTRKILSSEKQEKAAAERIFANEQ